MRACAYSLIVACYACFTSACADGTVVKNGGVRDSAGRSVSQQRQGAARALTDAMRMLGHDADASDSQVAIADTDGIIALEDIESAARRLGLVGQILTCGPTELLAESRPSIHLVGKNNSWAVIIAKDRSDGRVCLRFADDGSIKWLPASAIAANQDKSFRYLCLDRRDETSVSGRLFCPSSPITIGTVESSSDLKELTFVNLGSTPLTIHEHRFDCSCARLVFESETIPANGFVRAKLSLDSSRKVSRDFNLQCRIVTDSADASACYFSVKGRAKTPARFVPAVVPVSDVTPDEFGLRDYTLTLQGDPAEITSATPIFLDPALRWNGFETTESGIAVRVSLDLSRLKVDPDTEEFAASLVIRTNRPIDGLNQATLVGRRREAIEVNPRIVFVGNCGAGVEVHHELRLLRPTGGDVTISSADEDIVSGKVVGDRVRLSIKAPKREGFFRTTALVLAGRYATTVPIVGIVKPPELATDPTN